LTIVNLDLSVTVSTNTIVSNQDGATYQWIDCSTNLPIENETNQSLVVTVNGDYAVVVTIGSCNGTTECENIIVEGIEVTSEIQYNIYPNPNNGQFIIELTDDATIEVSDALGRIIYLQEHESGASAINLDDAQASVYYVRVISDGKTSVKKIVVHK
jgi:hypothetical protein